jgi:hypothetical protein
MRSRLVYATSQDDHSIVTIDYDETLKLFLTQKERLPFSAERIVKMLDGWAKVHHVHLIGICRLHIALGTAHCILTKPAIMALLQQYALHPDWHIDFPFAASMLTCATEGGQR